MKKQIISETKNYEQSTVDELLLDDTPKVNSFNFVTSDGVARAISGASGEVPVVTEGDNGKVLKAIYDAGGPAVEWGEATVDQTYDAASTNAQSGVAVAQAIANIPSEVTTASGHFDLEGSVPVKVNYTGTASTETQFVTLSIDASKGVGTGTCGFNTENNKSLGANTATLVFKEPFVLGPAATFGGFNCYVFYGTADNPGNGPTLTLSPNKPTTVQIGSDMCIAAQSVTLSGANPLGETYPQGEYIGVMISGANTAIIAASMDSARSNGSIEIQHYPKSVATGYETTIPVVDQNYHSESTNAQSGTAVAQAIAAIPSASYTAGNGIDITANEVSVKTGSGLAINSGSSTVSITLQTLDTTGGAYGLNSLGVLTADAVAALRAGAVTVTPVGAFTAVASEGRTPYIAVLAINNYGYPIKSAGVIIPLGQPSMPVVDTSFTLAATPFSIDFTQLDTEKTTLSFDTVAANPSSFCIAMISANSSFSITDPGSTTGSSYGTYQDCSTLSYSSVGDGSVYVVNPIATPGSDAAGKVLTVTDTQGNYGWQPVPQELPASLGTAGQVLTVNSGATGVEWATPSGGGGAGALYVTYSRPASASAAVTMATTIKSALDANKAVFLKYNTSIIPLVDFQYEAGLPGFETVVMIFNGMSQHFNNSLTCYTWDVQVSMGSLVEDGIKTYTISTN